jgi:outer membrane protein
VTPTIAPVGTARRVRTARLALAAALALGAVAPAGASGLVEAWRSAQRHDAELDVARASRAAGAARATQAGALWQPQVGLSATAGIGRSETSVDGARFSAPGFGASDGVAFRTSVDGPSARLALAARQPLWSGERRAQSRQLELSAQAAEFEWRAAEQQAMLRVAERWLELSLAEASLGVAERQRAAVERALSEATDRWRIGDAPVVGTHEARARHEAVRAQRLAAQTERELRAVALADLTGLPHDAMRPGRPTRAPATDAAGPVDRWLAEAGVSNPGLLAREAAVRIAIEDAARHARGAGASVDLVAQASRDRISGTGDFGASASAATQALVGVQLSVPLWTGGMRDARHEEALRLVERAQAELERTRREIARAVRAAWLGLTTGAARVEALEQARVASAARLASTRTGQEVGDRTTLDVLNAENDFAQAELVLAQARVGLLLDRLRLDALAGRVDESSLAAVDAALDAAR